MIRGRHKVHYRSVMVGDNITVEYQDANGIDVTRTGTVASITEALGMVVYRVENGGILVQHEVGADMRIILNKAAPIEMTALF